MIDEEYLSWLPPLDRPRRAAYTQMPLPNKSRASRRAQHSNTQHLFKKDRSVCAKEVLSGAWKMDKHHVHLEVQTPFWQTIFTKPSVLDDRRPEPVGPTLWELVTPVTIEELNTTIGAMKKGAAGPDRRSFKQFKDIPREELRAQYNLWLLPSYQPAACRKGETVLIPKVSDTHKPEKHRPITISDFVIRCFHKVMAQRLERLLPISPRQKAFRAGDGVADNIWLLRNIIRHHQDELKPLNVVFVDVKKAFDSVSHYSLLNAATRLGVPPPLLSYLHELYKDSHTCLRVGINISDPIHVTQGVKQGDPMSVHLFNAVIDWALSKIHTLIGIRIGSTIISEAAFADDLALFASTPAGLQSQLNKFAEHLRSCGLNISAGPKGKSASLRIEIDGRKKKWIVNPHQHLMILNQQVPALFISDTYQYLGVPLSAAETRPDVHLNLEKGLENLTSAPLKPQQRLHILINHLLPSLSHQLVLAINTVK